MVVGVGIRWSITTDVSGLTLDETGTRISRRYKNLQLGVVYSPALPPSKHRSALCQRPLMLLSRTFFSYTTH